MYTVTVSFTQLSCQLEVHNTNKPSTQQCGEEKSNQGSFAFTTLLHTYFTVDDIAKLAISGLGNTPYVDKVRV